MPTVYPHLINQIYKNRQVLKFFHLFQSRMCSISYGVYLKVVAKGYDQEERESYSTVLWRMAC